MSNEETKPTVAVLLPMGGAFDIVFDAIAETCRELGISCQKVPAEFSQPAAMAQVKDFIQSASIVVGEITSRNPNIYYQLGYAHALNKRLLLITQHGENLSFDRNTHTILVYAGNTSFLKKELSQFLSSPNQQNVDSTPPPTEESGPDPKADREKFMSLFGDILQQHGYHHRGGVYMESPSTFVVVEQDMSLALVQDLARKARGLGIRVKLL